MRAQTLVDSTLIASPLFALGLGVACPEQIAGIPAAGLHGDVSCAQGVWHETTIKSL